MKIVLLSVQSGKEEWFQAACDVYSEKISHYASFELSFLKSKAHGREEKQIKCKLESESILEKLKSDDFVVLCDERGKALDSMQFSKQLETWIISGKKRVVFIVGGAFGVSDELKKRAQFTWSLSPMVMNHLVAQTVALEQIYRGLTIWKGIPYHNQ